MKKALLLLMVVLLTFIPLPLTSQGAYATTTGILRIEESAFKAGAGQITFSEFPLKTKNPVYAPSKYGGKAGSSPTVRFSGFYVGQSLSSNPGVDCQGGAASGCVTGQPSSPLTLNSGSPETFIASDSSAPNSPVLSGSPRFNGPITILFDKNVAGVGLAGGYFNGIEGTAITAFARDGSKLGQVKNQQLGHEFLGLVTNDGSEKIAGLQFSLVGNEPSGFAIDNLRFAKASELVVPKTNIPPNLANPIPDQTATATQAFNFTVGSDTFSDVNGDSLTLSATLANGSALPSWLNFNANTKTFSGTPAKTDVGNISIKITANDGHGGTISDSFKLTVETADCQPHNGEISGVKWNDVNGDGKRQGEIVQGDIPDVFMVIDVSDSTAKNKFVGSIEIGDVNADGTSNTILDSQIEAFVNLNQQLIDQGLGEKAKVGIIVFGSRSTAIDLDPKTPGQQETLAPLTDSNGDGKSDLEAILLGLKDRAYGVGGKTNFEAGLQTVQSLVQKLETKPGKGTLVFLSDGKPTEGGDYTDEVESLKAGGVKLVAFGAGKDASLPALQKIDPQAEIFTTTDKILDVFSGLKARQGINKAGNLQEVGLGKVTIYLDLNKNGQLDSDEPARITGNNGRYKFRDLALGSYIVREVPENYKQTAPKDGFAQVNLTADKPKATVNFGNQVKQSNATTLININAKINNKDNPISQTFPAGGYQVSIMGLADGGIYDSWNSSGKVRECDGNGENCSLGWETRYYFREPYNKVTDGNCTKPKYGSCRYDSATKAQEKAPAPVLFSLDEETEMLFYIEDRKPSNNAGGVSLKVERL